jgi:hypothetical protein
MLMWLGAWNQPTMNSVQAQYSTYHSNNQGGIKSVEIELKVAPT